MQPLPGANEKARLQAAGLVKKFLTIYLKLYKM
jgi:hypothetical protein